EPTAPGNCLIAPGAIGRNVVTVGTSTTSRVVGSPGASASTSKRVSTSSRKRMRRRSPGIFGPQLTRAQQLGTNEHVPECAAKRTPGEHAQDRRIPPALPSGCNRSGDRPPAWSQRRAAERPEGHGKLAVSSPDSPVAQGIEHPPPKRGAGSSILPGRATFEINRRVVLFWTKTDQKPDL